MEASGLASFLRAGATACVAWDGAATLLVSVDGGPFAPVFPPDVTVGPGAAAGAGIFPVIWGHKGSAVEWSMRGELGLARPSPAYAPFDQARTLEGDGDGDGDGGA